MYDSLHELGKEKHYDKYQGFAYAVFLAGLGISSVFSGYIYDSLGSRWPYYLSVISLLLAIVILIMLKEPKFHKPESDNNFLKHVKASIKIIIQNKTIFHLSFFIVVASILNSTLYEYIGLYYIYIGISAVAMGYADSLKLFSASIGQLIAPKIGRKALKLIPFLFIAFGLFSVIQSAWGLIMLYFTIFLYYMLRNQTEAEIQDNTPSYVRATTLSVLGFLSNVALIPLGLAFGWLAGAQNVFSSYQMIALIAMLYLIIWFVFGRKYTRLVYG